MYIYEGQNWTDFSWDEKVVTPLLSGVRFLQGSFLTRIDSLGFEVNSQLEVDAVSNEVIASSQIEGVKLNAGEVRSSVARNLGITHLASPDETPSVDGVVSIIIDATQNHAEPLTKERLCAWHSALFPTGYSSPYKIDIGTYRKSAMSVVSGPAGHEKTHYEAPSSDQVSTLMDEFISWLNDVEMEQLIKAAIAHLWFLTIHPFDDGNGRIARAITEMMLARSDSSPRRYYSMATYILAHRKDYYNAIERAEKRTSDVTEWIVWFLSALQGAIEESDVTVSSVLHREAWWQGVAGVQLNERQRKMLRLLLDNFEGKLTSGKWAKICKVSSDTALRDINDLVNKGLLKRDESAGGRSTSYLLVKERAAANASLTRQRVIESIAEIASRFPGIERAWLFGSFARNQQTTDSDIDIRLEVDREAGFNLHDLASFTKMIEQETGRACDVITASMIKSRSLAQAIEQDGVCAYERKEK